MELPYLTLPLSGKRLIELLEQRITELREEHVLLLLDEKRIEEELEHQRKLAENDVTDIGCGTFRTSSRSTNLQGRSSKKLERVIVSLIRVCSLVDPEGTYSLTIVDLLRLDLITDTQSTFSNF